MPRSLRIGTRGSALALVQARAVQAALAEVSPSLGSSLHAITTTGDEVTDRPLDQIGGKALFTKEIDRALLAGEIDCAVHSMKDMESVLAEGLVIAAVLPRADPLDCLIGAESLAHLPHGARLGTSALRRTAQALAMHRDLSIMPLRGNVDTRLAKWQRGECDAIILAKAGLDRLGRAGTISHVFTPDEMLPAAGQGIIALVARAGDTPTLSLLAPIDHEPTHLAGTAERSFVAGLGGSCRSPIAAYAQISHERLLLKGALLSRDGAEFVRERIDGPSAQAAALGLALAGRVKAKASPALLAVLAE